MTDKEPGMNPQLNQSLECPVCGEALAWQIARGRKSGKPFLMLKCLRDGRHFRGFINHRAYVQAVVDKLEALQQSQEIKES